MKTLLKRQTGDDPEHLGMNAGISRVGTASEPSRFGDIGIEEPDEEEAAQEK